MMKTYKFKAEIKKHPKVNAAFIEFPYPVEEEFGTKGQVKVRVEFDGYEYRGSLAKMGYHCHCVGITQEIRKAIGKEPGDIIQVVLTKDKSPRIIEVPEDLAALLNKNLEVKKYFDDLSYTHKKEYVEWIVSAKKAETREKRLKKTIEMLTGKIKHP
jgi:bifunctional DNA-binding transcriptional regulator/antitoxin component of YhaV-PrlF toxin-antitoxin module